MRMRFLLLALPFALAVAACKPQAQPATAPAASTPQPVAEAAAEAKAPAPASAPAGTDVISVVDNTPPAKVATASGATLDGKSLAGKFSDGESVLELRPDGGYVQTLQLAGSTIDSDGHWAPDGKHAIKLDPNSKQAEDVRFDVVSADTLKDAGGREFKRVAE